MYDKITRLVEYSIDSLITVSISTSCITTTLRLLTMTVCETSNYPLYLPYSIINNHTLPSLFIINIETIAHSSTWWKHFLDMIVHSSSTRHNISSSVPISSVCMIIVLRWLSIISIEYSRHNRLPDQVYLDIEEHTILLFTTHSSNYIES